MLNLFLILIAVAGFVAIAYRGDRIMYTSILGAVLTLITLVSSASGILTVLFALITAATLVFSLPGVRTKLISAPMLSMVRKILPPISETEQEAIDAGTVWWDGELFSGKPNWNSLLSAAKPELSEEEQAFLDGPVNELSRMSNAWKINHDWSIIPDEIIQYVLDNGFLGMIIPKKYGGLDFSAVAQSRVLLKLSNTGSGISYLVGVPNSLGPGELLIKYGTEAQKEYYLPRLASGKEIPCFALTSPTAGSDATSISDTGVVCMGEHEGEQVLGIKLNFSKRYITLAPIATLIGLAFRLQDPDGLIGDTEDYGITCALIPRSTPGLEIGRRHLPIGDAFLNGPIKGEDLFVPLDSIIGGKEMAGKGWRMLVNCLSVGRAVTLPTTGQVISKRCTLGTSSYANLRSQFGVNIAKFEGVQKPLARMAGLTYIIEAASIQTIQSIVDGNKPSVPSAILKYHCTEMARQCVIDAMDIHGGKAVMKGPGNYISSLYESVPVAITVEGANILTRNLMIFGQGAIRSHPYVLDEMELAHAEDNQETLKKFDTVLSSHIGYGATNFARSLVLGLGFPGASIKENKNVDPYYKHINRLSGIFALAADASMLSLGAKLKFKENLSARLGDLLSTLFLASMVLKHHKDTGYNEEEWPIVQWSLDHLLHEYQIAFDELMANFPNRAVAFMVKKAAFPIGGGFKAPTDNLEKKVVEVISTNNASRDRLTDGLYMELEELNPLAQANKVFLDSLELQPLQAKLKTAIKDGTLPKTFGQELLDAAVKQAVITAQEAEQLSNHYADVMGVVNVDDFDESELIRVAYKKPRAKKAALKKAV
ncbi:acyl-CoA dehydrogenase [Cocleimonas sp. KMM 6892]|uniref:acyl-CoA dehydrogenase n=1 Tax=unclassified Cocleimonas TaxID=2639732 RepID=UPI002DBBAABB|nr:MULTISPECIES: acyl-CoA dehydrogenase [unclassified Cocleimonas]MEB8430619.1 acyl-CoA dehydrogenase [Cocleimonas sp. KMM 6892]MEC4716930.1 acyl-CoA dehydrogenase [Cocleimonas sp. KMM 6895]MEC4743942.1 acyl-CoA dehydrogenase [Cocleimonas sp. KMM 6896]